MNREEIIGRETAEKLHRHMSMDVEIAFLNAYLNPDKWGSELDEIWDELTPKARETLTRIVMKN